MNSLPIQIYNDIQSPRSRSGHTRLGRGAYAGADDPDSEPDRARRFAKEPPRHDTPKSTPRTRTRPTCPPLTSLPASRQTSTAEPQQTADRARAPAEAKRAGALGDRARTCTPTTASQESIKGISIKFPANEVTALIGPSGSGKSTVVRCINRMHEEIPGARAEGKRACSTTSTCTTRRSTSRRCGARSGWCSRSRTRSRRCRSSTTSPPGLRLTGTKSENLREIGPPGAARRRACGARSRTG